MVPSSVLSWDDLWRAVRQAVGSGPRVLSAAAERSVLDEAFRRCDQEGCLGSLASLERTGGMQRWVRSRFRAWSRAGLGPEAIRDDGSVDGGLRPLFAAYRGLLSEMGAVDEPALSLWAAARLSAGPTGLFPQDRVLALEPPGDDAGVVLAIESFHRHAKEMLISLTSDTEGPARGDSTEELARRLRAWGFEETRCEAEATRPAGLATLTRCLFAPTAAPRPSSCDGLRAYGAPQGDGVALSVARRAREHLRAGTHPDEIVVVVPFWSESADGIVETLDAWGLRPWAEKRPSLATQPGIIALVQAASLPLRDWDSAALIRLLRNSRLRPRATLGPLPQPCRAAARAVAESRTFRNLAMLRQALERRALGANPPSPSGDPEGIRHPAKAERDRAALACLDYLESLLKPCAAPAAWTVQIQRLRTLGESLGVFETHETALGDLTASLDQWAGARTDPDEPIDWAEVLEVTTRLAADTRRSASSVQGTEVRVVTADLVAGARYDQVILAGLDEGAFPAREAIVLEDGTPSPKAVRAYAAEMRRFLRVLGAARRGVTFVYPTTDEHGETLLTAGFFEEVRRVVDAWNWGDQREELRRLDAVLPETLVGCPAEHRVRSVALAAQGESLEALRTLAGTPGDGPILAGTAAALHLRASRSGRGDHYSLYEGRTRDPAIGQRIHAAFGSGRLAMTASQLESLAYCPFQFFMRFVLRLDPGDDRGELEEERSARGSLLHRALEEVHTVVSATPRGLGVQVQEILPDAIRRFVESQPTPRGPVEASLQAIQLARLQREGRRYSRQFAEYLGGPGEGLLHSRCEVAFGRDGAAPALELGPADGGVAIRGVIDRLDLLTANGLRVLRVIDYKTGHVPPAGDVRGGIALQVPLYGMAAESLVAAEGDGPLLDAGYWGIGGKGFGKAVSMAVIRDGAVTPAETWQAMRTAMVRYIVELVRLMRNGDLPVAPCRQDCSRSCDYKTVCRIGEVRRAGRVWTGRPALEARE